METSANHQPVKTTLQVITLLLNQLLPQLKLFHIRQCEILSDNLLIKFFMSVHSIEEHSLLLQQFKVDELVPRQSIFSTIPLFLSIFQKEVKFELQPA